MAVLNQAMGSFGVPEGKGLPGPYKAFAPMPSPGNWLSLSFAVMYWAKPHWRRLETQLARWALALAEAKAGSSIPARMAIMAITTSNSIKVKAAKRGERMNGFMGENG